MNQISITEIKSFLLNPSPLWGEHKGEGRLGHLEIRRLGFIWDLEIGIWDFFLPGYSRKIETDHGEN